jgi:hypothetical protein
MPDWRAGGRNATELQVVGLRAGWCPTKKALGFRLQQVGHARRKARFVPEP